MAFQNAAHRITVDEYHRMDAAAVFPHDARIELIEGALFERIVPMNGPHALVVEILDELLRTVVAGRARVRCQLPITLGDLSESQPDFAIVCGARSLLKPRHPGADEILAVVEISESSRDFDVHQKIPMYAKYGVAEAWVVDLIDSCVRVYKKPTRGVYSDTSIVSIDGFVRLSAFPESEIRCRDIFGSLTNRE